MGYQRRYGVLGGKERRGFFFPLLNLKIFGSTIFGVCTCILGPGEHSVFTDVILGVVRDRHQTFLFYTLVKSRNMMVQETQLFLY